MGHDHHDHEHGAHTHTHSAEVAVDLPAWADPSVPETELDPGGISRRKLLGTPGCSAAARPR